MAAKNKKAGLAEVDTTSDNQGSMSLKERFQATASFLTQSKTPSKKKKSTDVLQSPSKVQKSAHQLDISGPDGLEQEILEDGAEDLDCLEDAQIQSNVEGIVNDARFDIHPIEVRLCIF